MKIFREIKADTPGEEFARRSIERAGFLFTAAPIMAIPTTLVFGFQWPVIAILVYILTLTAAEGVAGVIYLAVLSIESGRLPNRVMAPASA